MLQGNQTAGGGDAADSALRAMVGTHGAAVYAAALGILRNRAIAEEVAQDVFVAMWTQPGGYDVLRGPLRAWLIGLARHKAIDAVRREERGRDKARLLSSAGGVKIREPFAEAELAADVRAALARLPQEKRTALELAYFGGLTYREVAAAQGVPEGTVKSRIRDALLSLRADIGAA
ncbi:MAG: RNA polymerase sigma factor [Actinomycetota bacterium]